MWSFMEDHINKRSYLETQVLSVEELQKTNMNSKVTKILLLTRRQFLIHKAYPKGYQKKWNDNSNVLFIHIFVYLISAVMTTVRKQDHTNIKRDLFLSTWGTRTRLDLDVHRIFVRLSYIPRATSFCQGIKIYRLHCALWFYSSESFWDKWWFFIDPLKTFHFIMLVVVSRKEVQLWSVRS